MYLVRELGSPQLRYPTVHVAGTSGKGSTATMIASVLEASGMRVGLHTKPHLHSVTERVRFGDGAISRERFANLLMEILPAIRRVARKHEQPSYYEITLALAFVAFAESKVDVAVVEAGVGGRLDGTNVLCPKVSVITNISLDHTEILGKTIREIAREKAGIAKPGTPLVSDARDPGARMEIESACRAVGAPFVSVEESVEIEEFVQDELSQRMVISTPLDRYEVCLSVLGAFQQRNAATAICALEQLSLELRPTRDAVELGLARAAIPGRMEIVGSRRKVVLDIAHNPDKVRRLVEGLSATFPGRRFVVVLAVGKTKDTESMLVQIRALPAQFIYTTFSVEGRESLPAAMLARAGHDSTIDGPLFEDPFDALAHARLVARGDDVIVVTGSTFIVSMLRKVCMFEEHVP
jgi:dihydrofolate synthase/folylpolyglutamate synthase